MIISPVTQQTRNMKWLSEHFPEDGSVLMSDITSLYAAINVVGPKAIELLSELTDESLSTTDFPQFTCKVNTSNYLVYTLFDIWITNQSIDGLV